MKKIGIIFSFLMITALALSACGGVKQNQTSTVAIPPSGSGLATDTTSGGSTGLETATTSSGTGGTTGTTTPGGGTGAATNSSGGSSSGSTTDTPGTGSGGLSTDTTGSSGSLGDTSTPQASAGGQTASAPNLVSNLIAYPVVDQNQQNVGKVSGFVISPNTGSFLYALVNTSGAAGSRSVMVPYNALVLSPAAGISSTGGTGAGSTSQPTSSAGSTGAMESTGTGGASSSATSTTGSPSSATESTTTGGSSSTTGTATTGGTAVSNGTETPGASTQNVFVLQGITNSMLASAPEFNIASFSSSATAWDQDIRAYWGNAGIAVTGSSTGTMTPMTTGPPGAMETSTVASSPSSTTGTASPGSTATTPASGSISSSTGTTTASGTASMDTGTPSAMGATTTVTPGIPTTGASMNPALITDVTDVYVTDPSGASPGSVVDMIVDTSNGANRILYVVLANTQIQGSACLIPVPWSALSWGSQASSTGMSTATPSVSAGVTSSTQTPMATMGTSSPSETPAGMLTSTPSSASQYGTTGTPGSSSTQGAGPTPETVGGLTIGRLNATFPYDMTTLMSAPCYKSLNDLPTAGPVFDQVKSFWANPQAARSNPSTASTETPVAGTGTPGTGAGSSSSGSGGSGASGSGSVETGTASIGSLETGTITTGTPGGMMTGTPTP